LQLCFNNIYKKIKYNHGNYQLSWLIYYISI
jgi:hypothetical protein